MNKKDLGIKLTKEGKAYKKDKQGVQTKMRKNEYKSLEQFTAQYTGEWNPSEEHWLGLDFMYSNIEYRFHTGLMYDTEKKLPDGREIMYGLYRKNKNSYGEEREYELLGEYANMNEVLESRVIDNRCFKEIIMDDDTELMGQD